MRKSATNEALPGLSDVTPRRGGPVYRGVARSLTAAVDAGRLDNHRDGGALELAKSLAHQVDLAGGYGGTKREPYALASLSRELRGVMADLTGTGIPEAVPSWLDEDGDDGTAGAPDYDAVS